MGPSGGLEKLKISGFNDPFFKEPAITDPNEIVVGINPASYSLSLGVCFTDQTAAGGTGKAQAFNRSLGSTLGFDLIFDGTGAVPDGSDKSVARQINELRRLTLDFNSKAHGPNYVVITWGETNFKGRCKSLALDYSLFNPDGSPLRAKAKLSFVGFQENRETRLEQNLNSPDMTHVVTVRPGDTLPLMCDRIYGDSSYYIKVAEANGLTGFRALAVGAAIVFPPLAGPSS